MAGLGGHLSQQDREILEREGRFDKPPEINSLDQAKIELYRLLLTEKNPDDLTENEADIMYHLSFERCIQEVLSNSKKPQT